MNEDGTVGVTPSVLWTIYYNYAHVAQQYFLLRFTKYIRVEWSNKRLVGKLDQHVCYYLVKKAENTTPMFL